MNEHQQLSIKFSREIFDFVNLALQKVSIEERQELSLDTDESVVLLLTVLTTNFDQLVTVLSAFHVFAIQFSKDLIIPESRIRNITLEELSKGLMVVDARSQVYFSIERFVSYYLGDEIPKELVSLFVKSANLDDFDRGLKNIQPLPGKPRRAKLSIRNFGKNSFGPARQAMIYILLGPQA